MKKIFLLSVLFSCGIIAQSNAGFNDWVTSLNIDSSGTIYAGTYSNGIFMSTDNGEHWKQTKMKYGVNSITLTVSNSIVSFAFGYSYGRYLFRLTGNGSALDSIALSFTPVSIVSGKNGLLYASTFGEGFYVSHDDGDNWSQVEVGLDPSFTLPLIAATKDSILFIGSKTGVWRSSDNGADWEQGFFNYHDSLTVQHIIVLNDSTIYAGAFEGMGVNLNEFFVSSDTGKNWNLTGSADFNLDAMAVDSAGKIYVGNSNGVYSISTEGDISHLGLDSIAVNGWGVRTLLPLQHDTIIAGGWGGVYLSSNGGLKWELMDNGLTSDTLKGSYTNPLPFGYYISSGAIANNGNLIVGTDSAGIFSSVDNGKTWMQTNVTVPFITSIVHDSLGNLFAGSLNNGVFKSANNGQSWTQITGVILSDRKVYTLSGHKAIVPQYGIDSTHMHPQYYCFAGADWGIYMYMISSDTWSPLGPDNIPIIAIEPLVCTDVVASTPGGKIYLSEGGWEGWNYKGDVGAGVKVIVSDGSSFLYAAGPDGLFRSMDKGATWEEKNFGIRDTNLISAVADKKGNIYVGAQNGDIYRSTDQGENWTRTATLDYPVRNIFIQTNNEKIYAAVAGRLFSIYNSPVVGVGNSAAPVINFFLSQNYPNPFNPETVIRYQLGSNSLVIIKVYDILGREIQTLVSEHQAAGKHTVTFNGGDLSSGVYFYWMRAGNFTATKKFLLMK